MTCCSYSLADQLSINSTSSVTPCQHLGASTYRVLCWGLREGAKVTKSLSPPSEDLTVGSGSRPCTSLNTTQGSALGLCNLGVKNELGEPRGSSREFPLGGRGLMSQHSSLGLKDALITFSLIITEISSHPAWGGEGAC